MLLSAVSVLVVAQSSSEVPEGLMNNPVLMNSPFIGEYDVWVLINYGFGHAALEGVWITQAGAVGERRFYL